MQAILASLSRKDYVWPYFNGPKAIPYINYCNGFQTIFFAGLLLFCLFGLKNVGRGSGLSAYIGIIALFGTFLFHIFWEANGRYSFPTVTLVLPYAAAGLGALITWVSGLISRKKHGDGNEA